jgi:hypothetical protein
MKSAVAGVFLFATVAAIIYLMAQLTPEQQQHAIEERTQAAREIIAHEKEKAREQVNPAHPYDPKIITDEEVKRARGAR